MKSVNDLRVFLPAWHDIITWNSKGSTETALHGRKLSEGLLVTYMLTLF